MQTRQWLVREVQRLHEHSTVHPNDLTRGDVCRVRKHARQKEELLPTSHARGEARGDERERQCMEGFCCCFVVVFSAYMTVKSTTLSEVRQNSSLHLVNRNTRGEGGTQIHKKTATGQPGRCFHTHTMRLRLGPEHSHSENNDFPLQVIVCRIRKGTKNQMSVKVESRSFVTLY